MPEYTMKLFLFMGISLFIHLLVLIFFIKSSDIFFNMMQNPSFLQISDIPVSHQINEEKPFYLGDDKITDRKTKPVIETNSEEQQKEADETNGNIKGMDFGAYVPFYQVDELPVAIIAISPVYPEEARRNGIEGRVIMLIYIDEEGTVKKVEIQKSPSDLLSESAMKAVKSAKFRPAKIGGKARAVCMQLTLHFKLE
jgi:TonB family protein